MPLMIFFTNTKPFTKIILYFSKQAILTYCQTLTFIDYWPTNFILSIFLLSLLTHFTIYFSVNIYEININVVYSYILILTKSQYKAKTHEVTHPESHPHPFSTLPVLTVGIRNQLGCQCIGSTCDQLLSDPWVSIVCFSETPSWVEV